MELLDVKRCLNKLISYRGTPYILTGCTLRKKETDFFYQAEIKDINANSLIICRLGELKQYEPNTNGG